MSIAQTVLVYVGIPVAVALIVTALVFSGGRRHRKRYRPGRPYDFAPVWFLAAPDQVTGNGPALTGRSPDKAEGQVSLPQSDGRPALWPGGKPLGETGGASDSW